jgi:hypothetical protein
VDLLKASNLLNRLGNNDYLSCFVKEYIEVEMKVFVERFDGHENTFLCRVLTTTNRKH